MRLVPIFLFNTCSPSHILRSARIIAARAMPARRDDRKPSVCLVCPMTDTLPAVLSSQPPLLQHEVGLALDHLLTACDESQRSHYQALLREPTFAARLAKLFACSQFASQLCRRFPQWLLDLHTSGDLDRSFDATDWATRLGMDTDCAADDVDCRLRQFRNREYLRIIWRDLNRLAATAEITADISSVAEIATQLAVDYHYRQQQVEWDSPTSARDGRAQPFIVLGMGKLGARELNLSSDIDLIFAYPEGGETYGGEASGGPKRVTNQEFFIRLGQRVIKTIGHNTADGFVFRVDMRLRPYGDSGALVLNFDALEEYYQDQGRDWERYAMIKARPIAESFCRNDFPAGERLLELLRPFTYRRYLDYSAFEALREMKMLIERDVQRRRLHDNINLGAGGIREIEFIAQCFQLIRGGREPQLQERNLQTVLATLGALGHLPQEAVDELQAANIFLRNTEHAIQAWLDQQTQDLPKHDLPRAALAHAMGCADWSDFSTQLSQQRDRVSAHFHNIIAAPADSTPIPVASKTAWPLLWADPEFTAEMLAPQLEQAGFDNATEAARRLLEL